MCDIVDSNSVFLVFFVMSLVIIGLELVRVFLFWRASRNKQEEEEGEGEGEDGVDSGYFAFCNDYLDFYSDYLDFKGTVFFDVLFDS